MTTLSIMTTLSMSIKDAAQTIGVGRTTVYFLINQRRLDTIKIGRRTLVKTDSIRALVEAS